MSQPFGEYRGCIIFIWPAYDPVHYSNSCTAYHRYTVDRVKQDIDNYLGDAPPTPEPPPPEPPDQDYIEETYRGVDIWWKVSINQYWAQVATGYTAVAATLTEMRAHIDEILAFLEPPEDPEEGLFAQVVAALKAWFLENIQPWVEKWGRMIDNSIAYIDESIHYWGDQITQFIDNSVTYIDDSINYWGDQITQYIDESVHYVDESINYWGDQITQNITNIIGVSEEWVNEKLVGVGSYINDRLLNYAPQGFQSNPEEYVKTHAEDRFNLRIFEAVKSFWEGFEEGQAE